ncbi:MAG TPA: RtcB family protein [Kofleriaceae bacterium]|nr:RtcB family protein [Kofleriaceae bacterium]
MKLRQVGPFVWEIPQEDRMLVPGRVFLAPQQADPDDQALQQVRNVAHLPGIVGWSIAMPDIHWGYGFPIGGIAATDASYGSVSPGGIGFDINCGVRLLTTGLDGDEAKPRMREVVTRLFQAVPTGVGSSSAIPKLGRPELKRLMRRGAAWAIERGFAAGEDDAAHCEEGGCLDGADPDAVSERALERGHDQVGTLGSGNHFLEVQEVDEIYDDEAAATFGLRVGGLTLMIHCGSRGLGHQVCDETVNQLARTMGTYGYDYANLPDRQLAAAPLHSDAGKRYVGAMQAAANFAWANRQVITGLALDAMASALKMPRPGLEARLLYDVCHNIGKVERHLVEGRERQLFVHRKGATRAFAAGDPRVPEAYRAVGQPVIIPGDMGRYSFVLAGNPAAMEQSFGSSCHGAGRVMSRHAALGRARGRRIDQEMRAKGIEIMARAPKTLAEEMSEAYKDVADVVDVVHGAGLCRKVARLRPLGVIKG